MIEKLKKLEVKATPMPWLFKTFLSASENHRGYGIGANGKGGFKFADIMPIDKDGLEGGANAALICSLRNLAPELIALWEISRKMADSAVAVREEGCLVDFWQAVDRLDAKAKEIL